MICVLQETKWGGRCTDHAHLNHENAFSIHGESVRQTRTSRKFRLHTEYQWTNSEIKDAATLRGCNTAQLERATSFLCAVVHLQLRLFEWGLPERTSRWASCVWWRRSCTPAAWVCCSRPPDTCCRRRRSSDSALPGGAAGSWCSTHSAGGTQTYQQSDHSSWEQDSAVEKTSRGGNTLLSAPAVFFHELCKNHKIKVCRRGFLNRAAPVQISSHPEVLFVCKWFSATSNDLQEIWFLETTQTACLQLGMLHCGTCQPSDNARSPSDYFPLSVGNLSIRVIQRLFISHSNCDFLHISYILFF